MNLIKTLHGPEIMLDTKVLQVLLYQKWYKSLRITNDEASSYDYSVLFVPKTIILLS